MLFSAVAALAAVSSVAAHGGVTSYVIGGTTYAGWSPYNDASSQVSIERPYSSYDPILNAAAATIHCNNNGSPSAHQLSATVPAGTVITAKWSQWTHAQGPVMVYMAKCTGSCSSTNSATVNWFKIAETGLKSGTVGNGTWGTGDVLDTLQYTATIPAALADGEYFIRHELLALHQANTPQFYPECGQLIITNGGGQSPTSDFLVKFPGGYSPSDPSININIYSTEAQTQTTYKVPGPPVWPSGSSTSVPSSPSSTSTIPPVTSTSASTTKPVTSTTTKTTPVTTTSSAPAALQTKYGQCGGQGYTGPTVCESGSTCKAVSPPYYSQCQ